MNTEVSFRTFVWAVIVGMGGHIGWGLISLILDLLQSALHKA